MLYFFVLNHPPVEFYVYLPVIFLMLFVNIMLKSLNTHWLLLYSLRKRILLSNKTRLLAGLVLLVAGLASPATAQTRFIRDFIITSGKANGTALGNTRYYTNAPGSNNPPSFQGKSLGNFNRSNVADKLFISAEANTFSQPGDDIQATQLLYRVYQVNPDGSDMSGITKGGFSPLSLAYQGAGNVSGNSKWNSTTKPNLLNSTSGPGTFRLELYFQGSFTRAATPPVTDLSFVDDRNGNFYQATFVVTGSAAPVAQWGAGANGAVDNNWFNPSNWDKGIVPDANTDVIILYKLGGRYPIIDGSNSLELARTRNLTIRNNSNAPGYALSLFGSFLFVSGNFQDPNNNFRQTGGFFVLNGIEDQVFEGSTTFFDIIISGGGTKTLTKQITVLNSLTLSSDGGSLVTRTDNTNAYSVILDTNARLIGESETGYVLGVVRSTQLVSQNSNFGNIGVELTVNSGSPGVTQATRVSRIYTGAGTSVSIRRGFTFLPANPILQDFSLVFHYLDPELNGISPANLRLFRSANGDVPFQPLNRTSYDAGSKTLTRNNISGTLAALFTLGDASAPLPVTVTSFAVAAQGPDALLTWTTAQELNNQGFEVQVSGDGTTFRKLGFVASETPNSSAPRTYQYRDAEAGKQGTRYYRLRQLDLDGKEGFFGPQAVAFGPSGLTATALQGFPNPFGPEINLALQAAAAGPATVSVLDGVGRQVRTWQPTLAVGASTLRLADLQNLPHGLYVVQVRYSDGQTQRLKVVKE